MSELRNAAHHLHLCGTVAVEGVAVVVAELEAERVSDRERLIGPDDFGLPSRIDVYARGIDGDGKEYGTRYELRFDEELVVRAEKVLADEEAAYRRGNNALPRRALVLRMLRAALHPGGMPDA